MTSKKKLRKKIKRLKRNIRWLKKSMVAIPKQPTVYVLSGSDNDGDGISPDNPVNDLAKALEELDINPDILDEPYCPGDYE
jgi:hypothetical protein